MNWCYDTFLISIGLKPGHKVKNQVSVPNWIKKDPNWIKNNQEEWEKIYHTRVIRCLRGLMDTDGYIFVSHKKKSNYTCIGIQFSNGSKPLVKDFKEMCESIGINTSKVSSYTGTSEKGTKYTAYRTRTSSKIQVKNFLEIVKPMKWEVKKEEITKKLESLGTNIEDIFKYKYKKL